MNVDISIYRARIGLHRYRLFKLKGFSCFNHFELVTFLAMLLYQAGDVEKNPGPDNNSNHDTSSQSSFPVFQGNFSVVHYNVQSLLQKIDIIEPELSNFDLVSLTETWLNERVLTQDLAFNNYRLPFRRDRVGDSHGGIVVYVKENIPCKRRHDLELNTIECIWLELNIKNKKLLVGTFYRPPNSTPLILADIENSIGLAIDTGIQNVVILGDFNLNFLNTQSKSKINNICRQFNLTQLITEPTNFAETSSTMIDLILVNNLRVWCR